MVGALAVVVVCAAACAYATLGLLFYQGQWQFVLHPVRTITATPRAQFEDVRFDVTDTGVPRLDGWWIPADPGARWSGDTVLYLHGGSGSLSNCVDELDALHALGINVFAFDYRGYGRSAGPHPNEARMNADADAAWNYLTQARHLDPAEVVVYGADVGATLAAELAARHTVSGVILDTPNERAWKLIQKDGRAWLLPTHLLLSERFDPADELQTLSVPKLFVDHNGARSRTVQLYHEAAAPKQYFELKNNAGYAVMMERFLDSVSTSTSSAKTNIP